MIRASALCWPCAAQIVDLIDNWPKYAGVAPDANGDNVRRQVRYCADETRDSVASKNQNTNVDRLPVPVAPESIDVKFLARFGLSPRAHEFTGRDSWKQEPTLRHSQSDVEEASRPGPF